MLQSLCVAVPDGVAVVDQVQFAVLLPRTDHEVFGVEVVVHEVLEVVVLQDAYGLLAEHQDAFEGKLVGTAGE